VQGMYGGYPTPACTLDIIYDSDIYEKGKNKEPLAHSIEELDLIGGKREKVYPSAASRPLKPGDLYCVQYWGGGGSGDPIERAPKLIVQDFENQVTHLRTIEDVYCAKIDPETLEIDEAKTKEMRDKRKKERLAQGIPGREYVKIMVEQRKSRDLPEPVLQFYDEMMQFSEGFRQEISFEETFAAAEPKAAEKPAARQIEEETPKQAVSIQPTEPEISPAAEATISEPISLKPLKQKIKVGKTKEEEALEKKRLNQVVQRIKARADEKAAREKADQAARDAVSKLADTLKTTTGVASSETSDTVSAQETSTERIGISGPRGTGIEPDFYMKQYLAAAYQKIHDNWVLPDLQNWDNSLEAVLVITIQRDGTIADSYFEKKSDNIYFNQFVLKAAKDSSPLPPFPEQLEENSLEIGLRFKPGELY